jgi:hypothetical protein
MAVGYRAPVRLHHVDAAARRGQGSGEHAGTAVQVPRALAAAWGEQAQDNARERVRRGRMDLPEPGGVDRPLATDGGFAYPCRPGHHRSATVRSRPSHEDGHVTAGRGDRLDDGAGRPPLAGQRQRLDRRMRDQAPVDRYHVV